MNQKILHLFLQPWLTLRFLNEAGRGREPAPTTALSHPDSGLERAAPPVPGGNYSSDGPDVCMEVAEVHSRPIGSPE